MVTGSKIADSTITEVVAGPTSVPAPPMTPAIPIGTLASVISSVSGVSVRTTWSIVSMVSPARADRTVIRYRPSSPGTRRAASYAWVGLPSSTMT